MQHLALLSSNSDQDFLSGWDRQTDGRTKAVGTTCRQVSRQTKEFDATTWIRHHKVDPGDQEHPDPVLTGATPYDPRQKKSKDQLTGAMPHVPRQRHVHYVHNYTSIVIDPSGSSSNDQRRSTYETEENSIRTQKTTPNPSSTPTWSAPIGQSNFDQQLW